MPKLRPSNALHSNSENGSVLDPPAEETRNLLKALDSVPALIAYVNTDLKYGYINSSYQKWLGLNKSVVGKSVVETLGVDVYLQIRPYIEKVLNGEACHFEYVTNYNDNLRWIDASYTPDVNGSDEVRGYTVQLTDVTDKKRAERALKDYVENGNIGLHWVDAHGVIVWANAAELKMLGYQHDEYIGHHITEFHADQNIIKEILSCLSRNEVLVDCEAILKAKDGSTRHVLINSSVYRENDNFIHTRCFTVDITARKQAEAQLRKSELQFAQLVNSLPVAFYTCDKEGRITYFNEVAAKLWGYKPELNSDARKFCACYKVWMMDGTFVPPEKTPMAIAVQTGHSFQNVEALVEREDGSKFYACVNIDPIFDESKNLIGAINVFQDITPLKSTEFALRESHHRYKEVIELLPSAVYTCDIEGKVQLFNKAAVDLWGRTPEAGKDMWCGSWKIRSG